MAETIYKAMINIVGENNVSDNFFELVNNALDPHPYEYEPGHTPLPHIVVKPGKEEEISEIFKYANHNDIPVYPRGSGTSLTGSARAPAKGIILSTSRLNSIEINPDDGFFECGPGVSVQELNLALEQHGYFLPVYPGSRLVATMGGMMAGNTSGHIIDSCIGKPADYVLGLNAVIPTGEIFETGSRAMRKPAGTDLTKFFVGNDGLTGIVTKIRMRLVPEKQKAFGIAYYPNSEAVARAVVRAYREKAPAPLFMEFMDKATTEVGFEHAGLPVPLGCSIFFATIGETHPMAVEKVDKLLDVLRMESPIEAEKIDDLKEWEKIWTAREVIIASLMQLHDGHFCGPEIVATLKNLVNCIKELEHYKKKIRRLKVYLTTCLAISELLPFIRRLLYPEHWKIPKKKQSLKQVSV